MDKDRSCSGGTIPAYSPRLLLSRWFLRHGGKKKREGKGGNGEESEGDGLRAVESLEVKEVVEECGKEEIFDSSGHESKDVSSLNLGMGVGLIFLLVRSTTEFNKMTELRKEMEALLRDVKCQIQKKDAMSTRGDSNSISFSVSDSSKNKNTSESDGNLSKYEIISESKHCRKMDQMEAELEAEFQRLHLGLEGDNSSVLPRHPETQFADGGSSPTESLSEIFDGDDDDVNNECSSEQFGISPRELERRLHELLEAQQQEKIAELESALELAEQRLHEKEMEICWWRDTAKLASHCNKDAALYR